MGAGGPECDTTFAALRIQDDPRRNDHNDTAARKGDDVPPALATDFNSRGSRMREA